MTETTLTPEDDDVLAAELALGLASKEDAETGHRRSATDRIFAGKLAFWQERLAAMTDTIDPVKPPARVKKKLFAQLFPKARVSLLQRVWLWQGIAMASLLFAGYLGVQLLEINTRPDRPSVVYAAQMQSADSPLQILAVVEPSTNEIALRRVAGDTIQGRSFELWAILPDQAPISLGVLPEGETARIAVPAELRNQTARITLAITDEPLGGSPTGGPTGDVLAAGAITEL